MARFAIVQTGLVIAMVDGLLPALDAGARLALVVPPSSPVDVGWGHGPDGFYRIGPAPEPVPPATQWLIDIGPFFDRFGAAKMALLTSGNATVQALVKDLQVRKWIDLQRADVAAGIDALIALGVAGIDAELKTAVLTTPVADAENFALRKVYFF
jgi:hypothetical protein